MAILESANPSNTKKTVRRNIFDSDPTDTVSITDTRVSLVDGSVPGSQPSWVSFTPVSQKVVNGRVQKPVDITLDITALRLGGIQSFQLEITATDGTVQATHEFNFTVDDLTSGGTWRLHYLDFDAQVSIARDVPAGTDPYKLTGYNYFQDERDLKPFSDQEFWEQFTAALSVDAEQAIAFTRRPQEGLFSGERYYAPKLVRREVGGGESTLRTGVVAQDIDEVNKQIYFLEGGGGGGDVDEQFGDGGLYVMDYQGGGVSKLSDNYGGEDSGQPHIRGLDIAIDEPSDTLIVGGLADTLLSNYSLIKTTLTSPDAGVSERIETGTVHAVDVDAGNGWVFATETAGKELVKRNLSDMSVDQTHDFGATSNDVYGITVVPQASRIYFHREKQLFYAPYSDISNHTLVASGRLVWPTASEVITTNAAPLADQKEITEWRVDTLSAGAFSEIQRLDISGTIGGFSSAVLADGGSRYYVADTNGPTIYQWDLSTAFDASSASQTKTFSPGFTPSGMLMSSNGSTLWVFDSDNQQFVEFTLSTPYEVDTASQNATFTLTNQPTDAVLSWGETGDKAYMADPSATTVREFALSTTDDLQSASQTDSRSFSSLNEVATIHWADRGAFLGDDSTDDSEVLGKLGSGVSGLTVDSAIPSLVSTGKTDGSVVFGIDPATLELVELRT